MSISVFTVEDAVDVLLDGPLGGDDRGNRHGR
jgi:hypothetical protein